MLKRSVNASVHIFVYVGAATDLWHADDLADTHGSIVHVKRFSMWLHKQILQRTP